jgi:transcriptional regulator with XRE-family HTH domain
MRSLTKKNLVYLRKRKGWDQEHLAKELGYPSSMYREYEDGLKPDIVFLCRLSLYFHVGMHDFLHTDLEERDKVFLKNRIYSLA